jgi:RNA polymerase sigma-70 factor (ECF subfamily)
MPDENKSMDAVYLNPGILIEHKENAVRLFKAINELPHQQRVAFTLIKVQGMKYEEACEILQLSVKAVESLVSRARVKLKSQLDNEY